MLLYARKVILNIGVIFHPTVPFEGKKKDGTILELKIKIIALKNCFLKIFLTKDQIRFSGK